jgi:hypothetical protein
MCQCKTFLEGTTTIVYGIFALDAEGKETIMHRTVEDQVLPLITTSREVLARFEDMVLQEVLDGTPMKIIQFNKFAEWPVGDPDKAEES